MVVNYIVKNEPLINKKENQTVSVPARSFYIHTLLRLPLQGFLVTLKDSSFTRH